MCLAQKRVPIAPVMLRPFILLSLLVTVATDDASFPVSPATRLDRGDEVAFLNSLVVE